MSRLSASSIRAGVPPPLTTGRSTRAEFSSLLDAVLPRAYAAARSMTGNTGDAEDLVQDAALLAWKGFARFERGSNFRAWFMKILANAFYSNYRREKRHANTVPLDDAPELYLYNKTNAAGFNQGDDNPAKTLVGKLDGEQVHEAIRRLPGEYRDAASLYFVDEFTYQEIADALQVPVGTVRSRLHRGRKLLQVALWQLAQELGIVPREADETDGNDVPVGRSDQ